MIASLMTSSVCQAASTCPTGYRLSASGDCQDINECLEGGRPQCGQLCTNTLGSFQCSCLAGYTIETDRWSCFVQDPKPSIMFSHGRAISKMNEGGTNLLPILQDVGTVHSFDYNIMHGRIYWIDTTRNVIGWSGLDGKNSEIIISRDVGRLESIAVDWISLRIYWSDSLFNQIESSNIYGTDRKVVIQTGTRTPSAIVLDPVEGYIFMSTTGRRQRIQRATMDGSGQTSIVKTGLEDIKSLVIDYVDRRLFWLDNGTRMIESSYYDGSERETVRSGMNSDCYGLSLFVDHIYWTRLTDQTISRANKYTGHDMVIITTTYLDSNPRSIHVVHPYRQPPISPTARLNCTTHGDCRIDIAEETLPEPKPFLIFTNQHNIQRINFDGTDYMQVANSDMMNLTALDYSPSEEMIYFVDGGRRVIERVGIDGRNRKVILSGLGIVNGIALDWLRGRLYWTDSERRHIATCSVYSCEPEVIVDTGLRNPTGIAVHPSLNLIYWTDMGAPGKIEAIRHDGRHRVTIATDNITTPISITIDYKNQRLLWIDSTRQVVETSKLDGTERRVITDTHLGHPHGISEFQEYVWFTEWNEDMIVRVNKATGEIRVRLRGSMTRPTGVQVVHPSRREISSINPCSVFNGGCEQICIQAHVNQVVCSCNSGHWLRSDGTTCNQDECWTRQHNCSVNALCEDADPGFVCRCKPGFKGDGHTCIAPTTPRSELIAPPHISYPYIPPSTTTSATRMLSFSEATHSATRHRGGAPLTTLRSTTVAKSTLPPKGGIPGGVPLPGSPGGVPLPGSAGGNPTYKGDGGGGGQQPGLGAEGTVSMVTGTRHPDDVLAITTRSGHFGECGPEYRYFCVNGGKCTWLRYIEKPACSCPSGYAGERCMYVEPNIPANGLSGAMVAAISVGILVPIFLVIVGIACIVHRRKSMMPKTVDTEISLQSLDRLQSRPRCDEPQSNTCDRPTTPPSPVSTTKLISPERPLPTASSTLPLYYSCKRKAPSVPSDTERYMEPAHIPTLRRTGMSGYQTPRKGAPAIMPKPQFKLAGGVAAHALMHRKLSIEQEKLEQDYADIDADLRSQSQYDLLVRSQGLRPDNLYVNTPKLIPKMSK
ncbi:low-density lipoprotein receptor-related protein 4-like [Asterias rubens]|uniref:low-density lipoprotein receptor-related protein 4-like n=1 Tax=Asterias rubens TaxID=7604 RepID=UPI001454F86F|nr:low-density lipoprotein receptor-related protein 4-like [Asterias rubens]